MPDRELGRKFNEQETLIAQMNEKDQQRIQRMQETRTKEEERIRERQTQEREENIKRMEEALTKKAEHDRKGPRPPNAPPPRMPTRVEIEEEARKEVQRSEAKELDQHRQGFDLAEKRLIEKSLQRRVEYRRENEPGRA